MGYLSRNAKREDEQQAKLDIGHRAMMLAAASTTEIANQVLSRLRSGSRSSDILLSCRLDGRINACTGNCDFFAVDDFVNRPVSDLLLSSMEPFQSLWSSLVSKPPTETIAMIAKTDLGDAPVEVTVQRFEDEILLRVNGPRHHHGPNVTRGEPSNQQIKSIADRVDQTIARIRERVG